MALEINPIGEVVAGRTEVTDDYWGGVESVIQLDKTEFPIDSVQGLEEFSTWWWCGTSIRHHLTMSSTTHGARGGTRSGHHGDVRAPQPPAPQPAGSELPRLLEVDGLRLRVTDLDAVVGTKIYDVSPFFTTMGPRGAVREPTWPTEMLVDYWVENG